MKPEHWNKAKEIIPKMLELPIQQRGEFLVDACGDDRELRAEIDELLAADPEGASFLEEPLSSLLGADGQVLEAGSQLGAYRVERQLGWGGMGAVYLAVRTHDEFQRKVALKVVHSHLPDEEAEQRFRREMEILANLTHPNIAGLYEGGRASDGRLYYLMEYVEGLPIDAYCRDHRLSLEARLRLFQKVCDAVQYAHQNLIVHRDIKPANILVTPEGEPKLLDFGVAKVLEGAGISSTLLTGANQRLFTPAYASPEQLTGDRINTASDTYSLGVLLYELLAGDRPHRVQNQLDAAARRVVCDEIPPLPSSTASKAADGFAQESRKLRGDLDTIVMMALRKEPERRYLSAARLSEDIENYLQGRPVQACPDTWPYKTGKFLRRHRVAALVVLVLFALGVGFLLYRDAQYRQMERLRQEAENTTRFLVELFEASNPYKRNRADATARELLERGMDRLDREFAADSPQKAALLSTIGEVLRNLGLHDQARTTLTQALHIYQDALPERTLEVARVHNNLGVLFNKTGEYDGSRSHLQDAYQMFQRGGADTASDSGVVLINLGSLELSCGHYEEAAENFRSALSVLDRNGDGATSRLASAASGLGVALYRLGRYEEAEMFYLRALEVRTALGQLEHPRTSTVLNTLGLLYKSLGRFEEAEAVYRRSLDLRQRFLAKNHPDIGTSLHNLGSLYLAQGEYADAEELFLRALEVKRSSLGNVHTSTALTLSSLGMVYSNMGEYSKAEEVYKEALGVQEQVLGVEHPRVALILNNLAVMYGRAGNFAKAEAAHLRALDIRENSFGDSHPAVAESLHNLATLYYLHQVEEKYAEGEGLLQDALEIRRDVLGDGHYRTAETKEALVKLRERL